LVKTKFKFVNIGIVKELEEDIPRILVDRNKMEQVFINVLLNAIHAMPKGGKITIRGYVKELKQIGNGIGRREGDSFRAGEKALMVEIKDTGTGIAEENIKKIFNPFFTTKGPGGGAGLGLSVSRSIIIMHKGFIDASSRVGEGTTITITLPVPKG
jgi:signal transduction histidine kinase